MQGILISSGAAAGSPPETGTDTHHQLQLNAVIFKKKILYQTSLGTVGHGRFMIFEMEIDQYNTKTVKSPYCHYT